MKVGKFDILKVGKYIETNSIKIGSDTDLYITPKNKIVIQSNQGEFKIQDNFLLFIPNEDEQGFGIYIDKTQAQIGYGNKEDFKNNNLLHSLTITKDGTNIPSGDGSTDNITINELKNTINTLQETVNTLNTQIENYETELAQIKEKLISFEDLYSLTIYAEEENI